ncbi:MAG: amidohydrolase family protein [Desulfobacterales bacterium]|jgi:imidazolonepropionase-like amidohydrolase|nr:amidohydrolase family protein [Desulfobacterales bacterium]
MNCVFARMMYTGQSINENAYLKIKSNKIAGVSKTAEGRLLGKFDVITPAFIDPHSHIGIYRAGEPNDQGESNERMNTFPVLSDVLDSLQMDDDAFKEAIEMGVLYSCIVPGSGNILSGRSAVIRHWAAHSNAALVSRAGIKAALGYNPMSTKDWKGERPTTRMGAMGLLREQLDDVNKKIKTRSRSAGKKKEEIVFSAAQEIFRDILQGKETLRTHVHKIDDIAALLRLAKEFKLKITVEHAMDVHGPEIFGELKKAGIPVIYGPVDAFASKVELKHKNWMNIRHLLDSGVQYGLMTDHPVTPARNLLMQTRWFIRAGLSKQQAVELISRRNAEILGIDRKLGTFRKGRWASFVCWNGDPFDLTKYPVAVFAEGSQIYPV